MLKQGQRVLRHYECYGAGYLTVFRVEITGEDEKGVTAVVPAAQDTGVRPNQRGA